MSQVWRVKCHYITKLITARDMDLRVRARGLGIRVWAQSFGFGLRPLRCFRVPSFEGFLQACLAWAL